MNTILRFIIIVMIFFPNHLFTQEINITDLHISDILSEIFNPKSTPEELIKHRTDSNSLIDNESRAIVNELVLENGFLLLEQLVQHWDGSNWVNLRLYKYTYDENNNRIEQLEQRWFGSSWVNLWLLTNTYNENNNLIEELWQESDGSSWVNLWLLTNTYDTNNNIIERLHQDWDGSNWVNYMLSTFSYDENNNMIELLVQDWDGSSWVNDMLYVFTYTITSINQFADEIFTYNLSNNYPNPFNPSTTIRYEIPVNSFVVLKVYDVLGKEIATLVNGDQEAGKYDIEFNGSNIYSGVYFYTIKASGFTDTKKFVLVK